MYRWLKMKAVPLILLLAGWALLWVLYQNRSASKIQEATVVIAGIIIGALLIITKSEPIKKTITPVYFLSTKEKKLLFFDAPALMSHYLQTGVIYGNYVRRKTDAKQDATFDIPKEHKPVLDLQVIAVLNHFSNYYGRTWYVERESKELPGSRMGLSSPKEESICEDVQLIDKNALPESLKQTIFFEDWQPLTTFAVPKGTGISYTDTQNEKDGRFCELRLYKPLNFDISIRVAFSSYMIGLGSVGQYLGLIDPEERLTRGDDPNVRDYGHVALRVTCKATFSRLRGWHPSVVRYKAWAANLFDDLYQTFDWSVVQEDMRRYQETLAHQKIIHSPPAKKK